MPPQGEVVVYSYCISSSLKNKAHHSLLRDGVLFIEEFALKILNVGTILQRQNVGTTLRIAVCLPVSVVLVVLKTATRYVPILWRTTEASCGASPGSFC